MHTTKHLCPSDVRRREGRKAKRAALAAQGLLAKQPNTFRHFVNRLNPKRSIFESPTAQQDLNKAICMYSYDTGAMEHSGGRTSVMTYEAAALAADLVSNGWGRATA